MKTRLPVRSALFKHDTGGLVVKWVTISESLLLYVFDVFDVFDILARGAERAIRDVIKQEKREKGPSLFAFRCVCACYHLEPALCALILRILQKCWRSLLSP
jgi:hypothetical protein